VAEVVQRQAAIGIDIVNDGELSKIDFSQYARMRLAGISPDSSDAGVDRRAHDVTLRDKREFPGTFASGLGWIGRVPDQLVVVNKPVFCVSQLRYIGHADVQQDVDNLVSALDIVNRERVATGQQPVRGFMSAVAPGTIEHWLWNEHYATDEAFLLAIADAMHEEYSAIVNAGLLLQIDDPDLADGWQMFPDMTVSQYVDYAKLRIAAINHALEGIPRSAVRLHVCWGSGHGPHKNDIPLNEIIDLILRVEAGFFSIEAANGRHEHEWRVWDGVELPENSKLMLGVVGHASDIVEHPELVADRLERTARLVGRHRIQAGSDCGLATRVGHPEIVWAKLEALVEGARMASRRLFGVSSGASQSDNAKMQPLSNPH
jgi:5-methyltetrahydropteroyltriglutamate--homocysteine methyltransferase